MRAFAAIGLAVGLVLAGGCNRAPQSVTVDPSLLSMVPADTVAIAGLRAEALQKTATWQRFASTPAARAHLKEFTEQTGFDLEKDLLEVLWATDGKEQLYFVRNRFSQMNIEPLVRREGFQRLAYKGYPILGNEEFGALFTNTSTAIVGRTARLRQLIDARDQQGAGVPAALREKINSIPGQSHFWLVASADAIRKAAPEGLPAGGPAGNLLMNLPRLMNGVDSFTLAADLTSGADVQATAYCRDEEAAKQWQNAVKGLVGFARLSVPAAHKDLLPLLDTFSAEQKGNTTGLKWTIGLEGLEKLRDAAGH